MLHLCCSMDWKCVSALDVEMPACSHWSNIFATDDSRLSAYWTVFSIFADAYPTTSQYRMKWYVKSFWCKVLCLSFVLHYFLFSIFLTHSHSLLVPPPHLTNFVAIRDLIELLARYDYICFVDFSWRTKQRTRCKYDWNSHHCICQWKKRDGNSKFDHAHRSSCPKTKILKQRSEMEMRPNIRNTHWKVFTVGIVWHMYVCVVQRYCKLCT